MKLKIAVTSMLLLVVAVQSQFSDVNARWTLRGRVDRRIQGGALIREADCSALQQQVSDLQDENQDLRTDKANLEQEVYRLQVENAELKEKNGNLERENVQLSDQLRDANMALTNANTRISDLTAANSALTVERDNIAAALRDTENKLRVCEAKLVTTYSPLTAQQPTTKVMTYAQGLAPEPMEPGDAGYRGQGVNGRGGKAGHMGGMGGGMGGGIGGGLRDGALSDCEVELVDCGRKLDNANGALVICLAQLK